MRDQLGLVVSSGSKRLAKARAVTATPDPLKGGDVYKWALEQAALIRAGRHQDVDWVNVADEIESVGKSEFRALKSLVEVIVVHMLKWDHQEKRSRSWINSIEESRDYVLENLSDNPSLKIRKEEAIEVAYRLGRRAAARQTDSNVTNFPPVCPYDWDAIMTRPFVLDETDKAS